MLKLLSNHDPRSNWWHEKFNQKQTLSESTILYGWHKESNNWEVLNYCLIVAKYNVFATSVRNGFLDFDSFLLRLNNKIDILRTIAFRDIFILVIKDTVVALQNCHLGDRRKWSLCRGGRYGEDGV